MILYKNVSTKIVKKKKNIHKPYTFCIKSCVLSCVPLTRDNKYNNNSYNNNNKINNNRIRKVKIIYINTTHNYFKIYMYISYLANYNKQNLIESVVLSLVEGGK